jgi:hypothetical protein
MQRSRTKATGLFLLAAAAAALAATEQSAGGLRWTVPAAWTVQPARPMRAATYAIPAATGAEAGECGVFFFGKGQGGTVSENLDRWTAQFENATAPSRGVQDHGGLRVHTIALSGTYLAPGGPMMQSQGKKPNWRLSGAIVEAPDGLVFFKCVGPISTIEKAQKDFERLLASLSKAQSA